MFTSFLSLKKFAGEGLRTLCLAIRDLDEVFFANWKQRHQEAALSMENRDEKLDSIYEEIERDMTLVGEIHVLVCIDIIHTYNCFGLKHFYVCRGDSY